MIDSHRVSSYRIRPTETEKFIEIENRISRILVLLEVTCELHKKFLKFVIVGIDVHVSLFATKYFDR
jgi:hypothetical protein